MLGRLLRRSEDGWWQAGICQCRTIRGFPHVGNFVETLKPWPVNEKRVLDDSPIFQLPVSS